MASWKVPIATSEAVVIQRRSDMLTVLPSEQHTKGEWPDFMEMPNAFFLPKPLDDDKLASLSNSLDRLHLPAAAV